MTPQEALDAIAALPAEVEPNGIGWLSADDVAEILDSVRPEGWNEHMRRFSETYPGWMFPGEYTDADWGNGPQVVALLRVIDGLKKQLADVSADPAQPVEGIVLTPEEIAVAKMALPDWATEHTGMPVKARQTAVRLAARLEASS